MLAGFNRALNLIIDETVIALVLPSVGNGPFHLVVDQLPRRLPGGAHEVWWDADALHIGPWALDISEGFAIWNPQPDWGKIRLGQLQVERLRELLAALGEWPQARRVALPERWRSPLSDGAAALSRALRAEDDAAVAEATSALSGMGPGLTPAGDDYLAGVMLALWGGHHQRRQELCSWMLSSTAGCTSRLASAFLAAASDGRVDERWQQFLSALAGIGDDAMNTANRAAEQKLAVAVHGVLAFGATSGMDMLMGFLTGLTWCQELADAASRREA